MGRGFSAKDSSSDSSSSSSDDEAPRGRGAKASSASSSDGRVGIDRPYVMGDLDHGPVGISARPDPNYGCASFPVLFAPFSFPVKRIQKLTGPLPFEFSPYDGRYSVLGFDDSQFLLYSQWKKGQGSDAADIPETLLASIGSGMRINANKSYKLAELYAPRQLTEPPNELDGVLTDRALIYVRRPVPTNEEVSECRTRRIHPLAVRLSFYVSPH